MDYYLNKYLVLAGIIELLSLWGQIYDRQELGTYRWNPPCHPARKVPARPRCRTSHLETYPPLTHRLGRARQ